MLKKFFLTVLIISSAIKFSGCEFGVVEEIPVEENIEVTGQIVETSTGDPVNNVSVKITDGVNQVNAITNASGSFTAAFPLTSDKELIIITFKQGFSTDTIKVFAAAGEDLTLPLIKIRQVQSSGNNTSGPAASIYLFSQSVKSVGVKESGSIEATQLIFEALDSAGVPITLANSIAINFRFGSSPGSGEYLYPASVQTNALGRASVTLNTGTKAGVIQVIAEATLPDRIITSNPILISVHGGFPDINHFDVAAELLNYPAYGLLGFEIPFTAFVGDKYTNPVRPGTSVYFSASSGIIEGSNLTDDMGRSTVRLLTQPFPDHEILGPGFFSVTASTINETQNEIETGTVRLLSGFPQITVTPSLIDLQNGGTQFFEFTVSDGNLNPLAGGTSITVTVSEGDIKLSGDTRIVLPDTQSKFYTSFSFAAFDSDPEETNVQQGVILISVSGPNGEAIRTISGTIR